MKKYEYSKNYFLNIGFITGYAESLKNELVLCIMKLYEDNQRITDLIKLSLVRFKRMGKKGFSFLYISFGSGHEKVIQRYNCFLILFY